MASIKCVVFLLMALMAAVLAKPADSDPAPLDCPENEVYYKCELEVCFKTCNHLKNFPACPSIAPGCVRQACLCKKDYLRNDKGVCIPADKCS